MSIMRVLLIALFFLSLTGISFGQNIEIANGYYRIDPGDGDYDWIVHIPSKRSERNISAVIITSSDR